MRRTAIALTLVAAFVSSGAARADDISDALSEAKTAYEAGDLSSTKRALEVASQFIGQKQADALARLTPDAPLGWTAEAVDRTAAGPAFFGGGTAVERKYVKGDKTVSLSLMADSPILGAMAPLFSNVQMLGGMGRVFRQQGRVAIFSDHKEIQMVLGKTFLSITGSGSEADKRAILDLLDLKAIEAFAK